MHEFPLDPGERVIRTVRTHWFVLAVSFIPYVFLAVLPLLLQAVFAAASAMSPQSAVAFAGIIGDNGWIRLFLGLWWLFLWIGAFNNFTRYYLNHWVITTARIVRVRQHHFFDREVSSFILIRVQDVTTDVHGIFADLLGYGSVRVQTAGTDSKEFVMDGIDNPTGMRDLIMSEVAALFKDRGPEQTKL
ncbi:MAG: PH domain-containing protein [Patescibacteria group bacterium]